MRLERIVADQRDESKKEARSTPDALETQMRHKSDTTRRVYIDMARQLDDAVGGCV
jgi:hypothetical protein